LWDPQPVELAADKRDMLLPRIETQSSKRSESFTDGAILAHS